MTLEIAVVGTGANPNERDRTGYAMAYRHARGYRRLDDCEIVACADIILENAERFAKEFDVPYVYENYETLLKEIEPDIVSVCVPPAVHAEIVKGCANSGVVNAIHCEKPMATTWSDCQEMVRVCEENDVQLTIGHQRRLGTPYQKAKKLLEKGAIGDLQRFEWSEDNIFDAGTHLFNLCDYYNDGTSAEWVLAGIDYREENVWFGAHNENQAFVQWKYENDVFGCASTGLGSSFVGCYLRLIGTDGVLELGVDGGPALRMKTNNTSGWKTIDTQGENIYGSKSKHKIDTVIQILASRFPAPIEDMLRHPTNYDKAIAEVVRAVRENDEPLLSAENALRSTELVFASWQSVRRRGRVDLPLEIKDNPLESMVNEGKLEITTEATQ